jgi:hypothetical protein
VRLELAYLSKLESFEDVVQLPNLEVLDVQRCKKLKGHELVTSLKRLRILRLNDCGEMANVAFVSGMPALEEFRFVNTNVIDGNLQPLARLKRVGFLAKKHYSHTPEQLDAVLRKGCSGPAVLR